MTEAEIKKLMEDRYLALSTYPNCGYSKGDIINPCVTLLVEYPDLYKKLQWWEGRENDCWLLAKIEYVRVIFYIGYYRVGNIVKVQSFRINTKTLKVEGVYLGSNENNFHALSDIEPATEEDYKIFKSVK